MPVISTNNLRYLLCVMLLISRLGDVGTTYLITPRLALEANPIVRRLGWRYAVLTIAACLLPYLSLQLAVAVLMPSLLVSASNAGKVWVVRTMGEQAYAAFLMELARKSKLSHALMGIAASSIFVVLAGAVILFFYSSSDDDWGFWLGSGVVAYGVIVGFYGALYMSRVFRRAAAPLDGGAGGR